MSTRTTKAKTSKGSGTTTTGARFNGVVKSFNRRRKFGFITVLTGKYTDKEVFVHISDVTVRDEHDAFLVPGEYVQLSISTNDKGLNAVSVTGIEGGRVLYDCPYFMGILNKLNKLTYESRGGHRRGNYSTRGRRTGGYRNNTRHTTGKRIEKEELDDDVLDAHSVEGEEVEEVEEVEIHSEEEET